MFAKRDPLPPVGAQEEEGEAFLQQRQPYIPPKEGEAPEPSDKVELFAGKEPERGTPATEMQKHRHTVLMESLDEEAERQREEREQAQINDDYYHHLQWTQADARVLMERGQAPLVYNISRGSIDWLLGTERRMRKDYKVRPRNQGAEQSAEVKTKLVKYTDDVNNAPMHRSRAFKDMAISGLGWLTEGIQTDPDKELIFSGSEDWRRMFRDSRGREFDQSDWRYLHKRKILDLDYAVALLPNGAAHLRMAADRWGTVDEEMDEIWYLGERLTNAATAAAQGESLYGAGNGWSVRSSGGVYDAGRRNTVEILESWYRVPETVKVFAGGPLHGKMVNPADPAHQQLITDRWRTYQTVKMRMRVMVGTKYEPIWDGVSPFRHGKFLDIPMFGYRRGRDGLIYGAMQGMRDPQDDLNKRMSKAQWAMANNQVTISKSNAEDAEEIRTEVNRPDGVMIVDDINNFRKEKFMGEISMNLEMADKAENFIRAAGGVTGDNLGQDTSARSGKAIIAKQEQGSLATYELFDNFLFAMKMAGQIRVSHIEQFCTMEWVVRIDEDAKPTQWLPVNKIDPNTGQVLNDITADQADFVVDSQDYRATIVQSAMEAMFALLTQIGTFAPQVVLNLLDLVVDSADVPKKQEWLTRIRKLNGQTDPGKEPTPEEQQAMLENAEKQKRMEQVQMATAEAQLAEIVSKAQKLGADTVLSKLQSLLAAIEGGATIATIPGAAPAADALADSAGYVDETTNSNAIQPPAHMNITPIATNTGASAPGAEGGLPMDAGPGPQIDPTIQPPA